MRQAERQRIEITKAHEQQMEELKKMTETEREKYKHEVDALKKKMEDAEKRKEEEKARLVVSSLCVACLAGLFIFPSCMRRSLWMETRRCWSLSAL